MSRTLSCLAIASALLAPAAAVTAAEVMKTAERPAAPQVRPVARPPASAAPASAAPGVARLSEFRVAPSAPQPTVVYGSSQSGFCRGLTQWIPPIWAVDVARWLTETSCGKPKRSARRADAT